MTNGEGVRQARVVTAGPAGLAAHVVLGGQRPAGLPLLPLSAHAGRTGANPLNVGVGNLFYGSDGWAAMSDQGFQAYKGDSSELIMEERPDRGAGDPTASTCRTSWPA